MGWIKVKYLGLHKTKEVLSEIKAAQDDFDRTMPEALRTALTRIRVGRTMVKGGLESAAPQAIVERALNVDIERAHLAFPNDLDPVWEDAILGGSYYGASRPQKLKVFTDVLHWLKMKRQRRWLQRLEFLAVKWLSPALHSERLLDEKSYLRRDIIGLFSGYYKRYPLYIVALPEFFFTDIDTSGKDRGIKNYSKPFYDETIKHFIGDPEPIGTSRPIRFKTLTRIVPNLVIFAGTIRWKVLDRATADRDPIFNTVNVFHEGTHTAGIHKMLSSSLDGMGPLKEDYYTRKSFNPYPSDQAISDNPRGFFSRVMPELHDGEMRPPVEQGPPVLDITHVGHGGHMSTITIGVDICMDIAWPGARMIDRYDLEANPMDFPTKAAKKPDIHLLIAAGMKDGDPKKAAQQLFIRCDGGNCAASPVSGGVSASYPTGSGSYHQIQVARKNGHFDIFKWYIEK